jgi:hypothetical protein
MRRGSCVAVILLLGLGILPAKLSAQQPGGSSSGNRGAPIAKLGQNYPNPLNPQTWIPFGLTDAALVNGQARVTIRIYNVLQQLVAIPVAENYPGGGSPPLDNLVFTQAGDFTAYWDGKDRSGQQVASGLYYYQLLVNGRSIWIKKMLVGK